MNRVVRRLTVGVRDPHPLTRSDTSDWTASATVPATDMKEHPREVHQLLVPAAELPAVPAQWLAYRMESGQAGGEEMNNQA
eukprot:COSAG02_NODE_1392_length_12911_cov_5.028957_6_plen_80_part_01